MDLAERLRVLRTGFTRTFWVANVLELFERFAFYGSKAVLAVYLNRTVGLGTTGNDLVGVYGAARLRPPDLRGRRRGPLRLQAQPHRLLHDLLRRVHAHRPRGLPGRPAVSCDALGKKGYVVLALVVTAIGGSLIKPCVVGTVARTTTEETKSLGYSIYYTLVNFGGVFGPILAREVRTRWGIAEVLLMSAAVSAAPRPRDAVLLQGARGLARGPHVREGDRGRGHGPAERAVHHVPRDLLGLLDHVLAGLLLPAVLRDGRPEDRAVRAPRDRGRARDHLSLGSRDRAHEEGPPDPRDGRAASRSRARPGSSSPSRRAGRASSRRCCSSRSASPCRRRASTSTSRTSRRRSRRARTWASRSCPSRSARSSRAGSSGYLIEHYLKGGNPGGMWILLSAIGFGATACMLLYDRFLAPKKAAA